MQKNMAQYHNLERDLCPHVSWPENIIFLQNSLNPFTVFLPNHFKGFYDQWIQLKLKQLQAALFPNLQDYRGSKAAMDATILVNQSSVRHHPLSFPLYFLYHNMVR